MTGNCGKTNLEYTKSNIVPIQNVPIASKIQVELLDGFVKEF